jgi:hypothetical protein
METIGVTHTEIQPTLSQSVICAISVVHHLIKIAKPTPQLQVTELSSIDSDFDDLQQSVIAIATIDHALQKGRV